jgi:amino acid adenylation domain-containing protein
VNAGLAAATASLAVAPAGLSSTTAGLSSTTAGLSSTTAGLAAAAGLAELPIQYADYAQWQRSWLQGAVLEAELAHWRERLHGLPPIVELPADRQRPRQRSGRGAVRGLAAGGELLPALRAAGRRVGATPFMVALAGLAALLRRAGSQESFALGVPVAGRGRVETEGLIGLFVNTLVLRCDVTARATGRTLIEQVRDTYLDADAHQDVPFEKLVEELSPERSLAHSPLFQVMLAFQNLPRRDQAAGGLAITPLGVAGSTAKFDLTLSVAADREQAALHAEYNVDLFDGATIVRLLAAYGRLLAAIAAAPERRLAELPLLDGAERHQLLVEWNVWNAGPPGGDRGRRAIHHDFEAQVDRHPALPAVTAPGEALTYRELDERANRLAHHLAAAGIRPGDLVGLCFERSAMLVVAVMAALKAGAAYLPLDPAYPSERLAFVLGNSGTAVVLTLRQLAGTLPQRDGLRVIAIDEEAAAIAARPPSRPAVPADGELPAYVIYTSGSTGRPKGVVIPHGNVTRLIGATAPWFGFGPDDVWTLFHSYAFDVSVWEMFGALTTGGRLVVVPYWESRTPETFLALLRAERVTVLGQTPAAFQQLMAAELGGAGSAPAAPRQAADAKTLGADTHADADERSALSLRVVIFAGEALDLPSLAPWFRRHGDRRPRLVNMYGITETTVHSTHRVIRQADLDAGCGSVVGVPIPDLSLHIVDEGLNVQPLGVPGEIVVGGEGVATGYLGQPELTAARFVPDPFGPPGARVYRSGDLARRLGDGDVEYLGRIDHQVKVRGFRIELGEIEAVLGRHPAVAQVVVALHREPADNPQLTAWYVAAAGQTVNVADLRAALRVELPDYMVPAWFVPLAAMPLTANGKVDRRALPAPGTGRPDLGREYVAPAGPVEERLAAIWAAVLRRDRVGAQDDFFALGGHSLLATQALSRMRQAFGMDLPLRLLFDRPTVAGVAEAIVQRELEQADEALLAELLAGLEDDGANS